jgi:folate-binding protein YgfZ
MTQHTPAVSAETLQGYEAARRTAASFDRTAVGWIVVSGTDRASYLHGLLTNDIATLKPGEGCYAAYLTPQGRMIADLWVFELGDVILLELPSEVKDLVLQKLDQFVFTEDVQLGDVSDTFGGVAVIGPASVAAVARLTGASVDAIGSLPNPGALRVAYRGEPAVVVRTSDMGVPGFELLTGREQIERLREALRDAGVVPIDAATAETLRIEAGVPRFHKDMDEETIPLEAGIESRAISLTKGCYVGQEVIIRVLHRGHGRVARKLVGLSIDGPPAPDAGAVVQGGGREIGRVTSSAWSPALHQPIALAYVHRDFVEPGTSVTVDGRDARVSALPFVPS